MHDGEADPLAAIRRNVSDTMQSQVEDFILGKIRSGDWPVGEKIPSERELSQRLDLSRTTVRNAIQSLSEKGLFDRRIGQGTFVRGGAGELPAGADVKSPKGTIGYVVCKERRARKPISAESFYFDVFAGIEEEASRSSRHLLFAWLDPTNPEEAASFADFLGKVDGLVLEEAQDPATLDLVADSGAAAVLLAPTAFHEGLDAITIDLPSGVRKAIGQLRSLGHTKIGIVNGPLAHESARVRFEAWKAEMRALAPGADDGWSEEAEAWTAEAGFAAAARLFARCPELTSVFCANDLLAVGALSALSERGLRVPDDVSVIGFDDTELARHTSPPLSTVKIHSRDMAREAVRRLLERLERPSMPAVRIEFPLDLVLRGSCKEVPE